MQAVILAGGQGTRLKPLTTETPKALVKIGERPIVEYLLRGMKKSGVDRVWLAVNHKADMIEDELKDGKKFGLDIKYSREKKQLSTVAPLKLIDELDDYFIVANGDILTDLNFYNIVENHLSNEAEVTVATYTRTDKVDFGVMTIDDNNRVTAFLEKPTFDYLVSMGIYVFSKSILSIIPENEPFGFDDLIFKMLRLKKPINTYRFDGYWLDIGRVDDYLTAQNEIEKIKSEIL